MRKIFRIFFNAAFTTAIAFFGLYGRFNLIILLSIVHAVYEELKEK